MPVPKAEKLLSLLAHSRRSQLDRVGARSTDGSTVTVQDVAGALAMSDSPLAYPVAMVKYGGMDVDFLWKWVRPALLRKWGNEEENVVRAIVEVAAADCLLGKICRVCQGQVKLYPENIECVGCGRAGVRKITDADRLEIIPTTPRRWRDYWRRRYILVCADILDAEAAAIKAVMPL